MPRNPDDPLERLQREVERLFHDLVYHRHPSSHFAEPAWSPCADLVVSEGEARVLLELAGVPRESVRVTLRGRALEVTGRRSPPLEPGAVHYHRAEIYFGDFRRRVELPWEADARTIQARFKNGMLEVHIQPARVPGPTEIPVQPKEGL